MRKLNILSLFYLLSMSGLFAQTTSFQSNVIYLTDSLLNQSRTITNNSNLWKCKSGDNINWSNPQYSDSSWTNTSFTSQDSVIWYRLNFKSDSSLKNAQLGLSGYHIGKIKIYYDGFFICSSLSRYPTSLPQINPGKHLLAIRYQFLPSAFSDGDYNGFFIQFHVLKKAMANLLQQRTEQMIFVTLPLAFALLHLILFIFLPSAKGNLYYCLFLILFAIATYSDIHSTYLSDYSQSNSYLLLHRFFIPLAEITFLLFFYEIFYNKLPKQFWGFFTAYIIIQILILKEPQDNFHYFVILSGFRTLEIIRVLCAALYKKKDGSLIFTISMTIVLIFGLYDALLDLEIMQPINNITNAYYFGFLALFIGSTVFLSRDFSRSNQQRQLLEVEDKRKSRELEDARHLQLSMLPRCLNDFPNLDVCFNLVPATEVGGDYYDFYADENNTLTIVVGDATGHGMKAGMMVSIIKSLFVADIRDCGLVPFMNKATHTIKQMKLGNIYMALQLIRIHNNKVTISSAGMPPVYIYRKKTDTVEEITIKAMPLGGPASLPYKEIETTINPGDVILMLSDGLPELFNARKEMLDYRPVISKFKESSHKTADEIVTELFQLGNTWRQEHHQEDDITVVVIKMKN